MTPVTYLSPHTHTQSHATNLLQLASNGEGPRPVKHSYVVKTEESAAEQIPSVGVLSVDPPSWKGR